MKNKFIHKWGSSGNPNWFRPHWCDDNKGFDHTPKQVKDPKCCAIDWDEVTCPDCLKLKQV